MDTKPDPFVGDLSGAIATLDGVIASLQAEADKKPGDVRVIEAVDRLLAIAARGGSLQCLAVDKVHLLFLLPNGIERSLELPIARVLLRSILARLAWLVNRYRLPELRELDGMLHDNHEVPNSLSYKFGRMIDTVGRYRQEVKKRGIAEVNPYGFEAVIDYPQEGNGVIQLVVATINGSPKLGPYQFSIRRLTAAPGPADIASS